MNNALRFILSVVFIISCFPSCDCDKDSEVSGGGTTAHNKALVGTKWTSQDWDFDIDDDGEWAYYFDEIYSVYFYSETEAVAYYSRKTVDSDEGKSRSSYACFFKYYYDGKIIKTETITSPFKEFQYEYTIENGMLKSNAYDMKKGFINSNDENWLKTITGKTGECSWYFDNCSGLTITGEGSMADYKSFESTPWYSKYHAINNVYILEGVKYIGSFSFASPMIGSVELPYSGLTAIGAYAFSGSSIDSFRLFKVSRVNEGAFNDCKYAKVFFYDSIEEIGDYACYNCKSVSLSKTPNLRKIGNGALSCDVDAWTDSKVLEFIGTAAVGKINKKEIDLPAIKELGHLAFHSTKLEKIHIGPTLQNVIGTPFVDVSNSGVLTVDMPTPLALHSDFIDENCVKNWKLIVPAGSDLKYMNAEYWKNFKSITNAEDSETGGTEEGIIQTLDAVPRVFDVKLSGHISSDVKNGEVYFQVSQSPDFSSIDTKTSTRFKISNLTGQSFEITLSNGIEPSKTYYYQAVYQYNSLKKYGKIKRFTTQNSKKPSNLSYTISGQTYKMIFVSGGPNGDFYMMQTELPHHCEITIDGITISQLDRSCDGHVIKSEWRQFIDDIRIETGIAWRLPTPEEWKYAAKGGNNSKGTKYSGSNNIADVAWYLENSQKYVHDCALKSPNELNIYDMSGNYAELTFEDNLYNVDGSFYGGCWKDAASACTVTSFKKGVQTGNISGTRLKEKNAFDGRYITVRLVYQAD